MGYTSGTVAHQSGCWGLTGGDGKFRPFIFYGIPILRNAGGRQVISYGGEEVGAGDRTMVVGQNASIGSLSGVIRIRAPKACGPEGVLVRNFSQIQRVKL
jgi:hypothetical protein